MQLTKHWAATLDDYVIDLAWSPDGALLAAASASGPVSLFAASDGAKQHELPGHQGGTNCVAWAGSALATGGQDGAVKFWDAAAGQHIATAKLGVAWVEHLAWKGTAEVRSEKSEVRTEETTTASELRTSAFVLRTSLLFAAAGRTLTALRPDASVAHTFKAAPKTISALALQPAHSTGSLRPGSGQGGGAVAAAHFGGVELWDADDFVAQKELSYGNGIHALVWSPDGKWLVSGNQDPSVHLWIPEQDIELHMSGYETKVKHLSFDHTSRWLATSGGRDACIWDCAGAGPEGREPAMLPHEAPVCAVKFQHAHGLLATASQDGVVQLWSPERKQPLRATVRMPAAATRFAWSPDDRFLAIGSEKGVVYVLKSESSA